MPFAAADTLLILPELFLTAAGLVLLLAATAGGREHERKIALGAIGVPRRDGAPPRRVGVHGEGASAVRLRGDVRPRPLQPVLQGPHARRRDRDDPLLAAVRRRLAVSVGRVLRPHPLRDRRDALHGVRDAPRVDRRRARAHGPLAVRPRGLFQAGDEVARGRREVLRPRRVLVGRPPVRDLARLRRDGHAVARRDREGPRRRAGDAAPRRRDHPRRAPACSSRSRRRRSTSGRRTCTRARRRRSPRSSRWGRSSRPTRSSRASSSRGSARAPATGPRSSRRRRRSRWSSGTSAPCSRRT